LAAARVPFNVRLVLPDLERPEPTKFDLFAAVDGLHQAVEDGVDQQLRTREGNLSLSAMLMRFRFNGDWLSLARLSDGV
jgi:hypothetical protein